MRRAYVWEAEPLAQIDVESSGERLIYLHSDHLATPRLATDSAGTLVWRWDDEAFGATAALTDPDGDGHVTEVPLRFPGQYFDAETGLHYNYFRDYDPVTGRYMESDPIGLAGGVNSYAYVGNNPSQWTDPTGLLFWGAFNAGESYGDSAAQYWADRAEQTGNTLYNIPGLFAVLWTPCTSDKTFATLTASFGIGRYLGKAVLAVFSCGKLQIFEPMDNKRLGLEASISNRDGGGAKTCFTTLESRNRGSSSLSVAFRVCRWP